MAEGGELQGEPLGIPAFVELGDSREHAGFHWNLLNQRCLKLARFAEGSSRGAEPCRGDFRGSSGGETPRHGVVRGPAARALRKSSRTGSRSTRWSSRYVVGALTYRSENRLGSGLSPIESPNPIGQRKGEETQSYRSNSIPAAVMAATVMTGSLISRFWPGARVMV